MGAVYLALDEAHRALALKTISPELHDPHRLDRFHREIEAVSSLRHANIVRLIRAGEAGGAPFALFERVRGRSMARLGSQPWPVVVNLGRQLARAAETVHAGGWLHRDLKRGNVIVGAHGLVTLLDFGLAKRWFDRNDRRRRPRATDPDLTEHGSVVGTMRYLAPELRRGGAATPATDVYSLGLVLHELLGGTVDADGNLTAPFARLPTVLSALLAATLDDDPCRRPTATTVAAVLDMLPWSAPTARTSSPSDELATWAGTADAVATQRLAS